VSEVSVPHQDSFVLRRGWRGGWRPNRRVFGPLCSRSRRSRPKLMAQAVTCSGIRGLCWICLIGPSWSITS